MSGKVFHAPLLHAHPGFILQSVVQRSQPTADQWYPGIHIHTAIDQLLQDQSLELIVINLPNQFHYEATKKALLAGKHVIVEKPFTLTVAEGEELIALAKKQKRTINVFQNRRWDGDFLTVKQVVEQGLVGRLVEAEMHYDRFRKIVDSDTWKENGPGAGTLYNLGSHMIDQALVLFGKPKSLDARIGIHRPGGHADDYYDIRMNYEDKLVILKTSYLVREAGPRYILHGTEGSFTKYGLDPQEEALKAGGIPGSSGWGEDSPSFYGTLNTEVGGLHYTGNIETIPGNYLAFYQGVYECLRENKKPVVSAEEGLDVIRVTQAAIDSNEQKKAINLT